MHIELEESSRDLTTFSTHKGLSRFCTLNEGSKPAAELFHNEVEKKMSSKDTISVYDDILMFGRTQKEHDEAVEFVLETAKKNNLTMNKDKCEFNKSEIKFYGLIFTENGIKPDPEKVEALKQAEPPTSKAELKSFLGMVTFSAEFIDKFSDHTMELRKLVREAVRWTWTDTHQKEFDYLKNSLCKNTM